ncbi:hypothetical protein SLEP1_g11318 [Rubroshorea leprosula]|uniref:BED-type domain-containing protein n=1 Tax=Rubroshorea leprosula TaxID=152421 RepID=A0AAV5IAY9_9ROSI|nr:hypothetical protein SLEP1_g11318 [Rubroshorea leprosula]
MNTSGFGNGTGDSIGSTPSKTDDPAWAHCLIIPSRRNQTKCLYCDKLKLGGGITRLKEHLAGIKGNVSACKKVSADVKRQMQQLLSELRKGKEKRKRLGDMDTPGAQKTIKNALQSREKQEASRMAIARWWYDANVPFHATRSKYYLPMWDAVTSMGPGFKGSSYHDLRDGWTNQRQQSIIYFLVYCPRGSMFLKSVDTSGLTKDADTLERMFDEVVKEVGVENVIQFITDNDASFKAAGKRYARSSVGKEVCEIVLEDREFSSNCILIVKISKPLVRVLRLVDNEEKPSMGYLYEAIDKAKVTIKKNFNNRLSQYMPYIKVIDARWDKQLYSPLHSAGCFLNPGIYFRLDFNKQTAVMRGLLNTLTTLIPDEEKQDLISSQLEEIICRGKKAMDPLSLENIDILADWMAEEPALLDKDDYNVDWAAIDESLSNQSLDDTDNVVYDKEDIPQIPENENENELWVGVNGVTGYGIPPNEDPYNYVQDI